MRDVGLRSAPDAEIWQYAKTHGFAIASKDTDFRERSFVEGFPPKVMWLDVGNAGKVPIEGLLRTEQLRIETFATAIDASCFSSFRFTQSFTRWSGPTAQTSLRSSSTTTCASRHDIPLHPTPPRRSRAAYQRG